MLGVEQTIRVIVMLWSSDTVGSNLLRVAMLHLLTGCFKQDNNACASVFDSKNPRNNTELFSYQISSSLNDASWLNNEICSSCRAPYLPTSSGSSGSRSRTPSGQGRSTFFEGACVLGAVEEDCETGRRNLRWCFACATGACDVITVFYSGRNNYILCLQLLGVLFLTSSSSVSDSSMTPHKLARLETLNYLLNTTVDLACPETLRQRLLVLIQQVPSKVVHLLFYSLCILII